MCNNEPGNGVRGEVGVRRISQTRQQTSVYNILFVNLAVTNVLSCVLMWLSNNLLVLFNEHMVTERADRHSET